MSIMDIEDSINSKSNEELITETKNELKGVCKEKQKVSAILDNIDYYLALKKQAIKNEHSLLSGRVEMLKSRLMSLSTDTIISANDDPDNPPRYIMDTESETDLNLVINARKSQVLVDADTFDIIAVLRNKTSVADALNISPSAITRALNANRPINSNKSYKGSMKMYSVDLAKVLENGQEDTYTISPIKLFTEITGKKLDFKNPDTVTQEQVSQSYKAMLAGKMYQGLADNNDVINTVDSKWTIV